MINFRFDQILKITVVDSIFNSYFLDMNFTYTQEFQAQKFLTNELLQTC